MEVDLKLFATWQPSKLMQCALWLCGIALAICVVVLLGVHRPESWVIAWFCLVAPMMVAIDLAEKRLPDLLTLPVAVACLISVVVCSAVSRDWSLAFQSVSAMLVLTVVFFLMFIVGKGAFGFGDVKLGLSMGLSLGVFGPLYVAWGTVLSFAYGAIVGIVMVLTGKATRNSGIAFGPYLILGTLSMFFVECLNSGL